MWTWTCFEVFRRSGIQVTYPSSSSLRVHGKVDDAWTGGRDATVAPFPVISAFPGDK